MKFLIINKNIKVRWDTEDFMCTACMRSRSDLIPLDGILAEPIGLFLFIIDLLSYCLTFYASQCQPRCEIFLQEGVDQHHRKRCQEQLCRPAGPDINLGQQLAVVASRLAHQGFKAAEETLHVCGKGVHGTVI